MVREGGRAGLCGLREWRERLPAESLGFCAPRSPGSHHQVVISKHLVAHIGKHLVLVL